MATPTGQPDALRLGAELLLDPGKWTFNHDAGGRTSRSRRAHDVVTVRRADMVASSNDLSLVSNAVTQRVVDVRLARTATRASQGGGG